MDSFRILSHLATLGATHILAIPIGWDREKSERSAGLRTFPLVAIAACGFVQATEALLNDRPEGAARIVDGVITRIGFIGGGAIVKHGTSVLGTATAAALFATGAVGIAVGLGAYGGAVVINPDMARQASRTGKERSTKAITAANKQPTPTSPTDQPRAGRAPSWRGNGAPCLQPAVDVQTVFPQQINRARGAHHHDEEMGCLRCRPAGEIQLVFP